MKTNHLGFISFEIHNDYSRYFNRSKIRKLYPENVKKFKNSIDFEMIHTLEIDGFTVPYHIIKLDDFNYYVFTPYNSFKFTLDYSEEKYSLSYLAENTGLNAKDIPKAEYNAILEVEYLIPKQLLDFYRHE